MIQPKSYVLVHVSTILINGSLKFDMLMSIMFMDSVILAMGQQLNTVDVFGITKSQSANIY
jgi:hypothetical protein